LHSGSNMASVSPFKVHLKVALIEMSNIQIEIINGWERRLRRSLHDKPRIVTESRGPGRHYQRGGSTRRRISQSDEHVAES
jgi:hypothetical protein